MQKKYLPAGLIILFLLLMFLSAYYLLFTTRGSVSVVKTALARYTKTKDIAIQTANGNLFEKLTLQNIDIEDVSWLPPASKLKIQKLDFYISSFGLEGINLEVFNGKLTLPDSESIYFSGQYNDGNLNFNIYSNYLSIKEIIATLSEKKDFADVSGIISQSDIYLTGRLWEPNFKGEIKIDNFSHKGFTVSDCSGFFNLRVNDIRTQPSIFGEAGINSGILSGRKTAVIHIKESKVFFNGDFKNPTFDLKGFSTVEKTKINIELKGTKVKPELKLSSVPALPQERLLLMLATNKSWNSAQASYAEKQLSAELAKDFIDYFVFSGTGSNLIRIFGLSGITVKFDQNSKGVGVKKTITEKFETGYAIEKSQSKDGATNTTQKIEGEYKITPSISVEAESELKQQDKTATSEKDMPADGKLTIQYKKQF